MKRSSILVWLALISLVISSCSSAAAKPEAGSPTPDQGPKVSFTAPASGAELPIGPVQVLLLSEDPLGTAQVELMVNGISVGTVASPNSTGASVTIEYTWQPPAAGKYVLQAHGQNTAGTWGGFTSLEITVAEPTEATTETQVLATNTLEPTGVIATPESATDTPISQNMTPTLTKNTAVTVKWSFSSLRMYAYGSTCEPQKNGVFVTVSGMDKSGIGSVMIFFRAKNKDTNALGKWSKALRLELFTSGVYGRGFSSAHFSQPLAFIPAIILHQFAISDKSGAIVYRSDVYQELYLAPCV